MVEHDHGDQYRLTELGRLAGEGGIEVESIVRLVEALASLDASSISDPTLISATQLTVELDQVLFPLNKRSTQKEPQTWRYELQRQGVPSSIMRVMHRVVSDQYQGTLRAKKSVACLLNITDRSMAEIETILTQFGGRPDGAAGAIRSVASRTCDLLPTVTRVAELLHPGLDLAERQKRLLTRLEVGVPAMALPLAMLMGTRLSRGDYQNLLKAGLCDLDAIDASADIELLACVGDSTAKVTEIRQAVKQFREHSGVPEAITLILPIYEG